RARTGGGIVETGHGVLRLEEAQREMAGQGYVQTAAGVGREGALEWQWRAAHAGAAIERDASGVHFAKQRLHERGEAVVAPGDAGADHVREQVAAGLDDAARGRRAGAEAIDVVVAEVEDDAENAVGIDGERGTDARGPNQAVIRPQA